jgi:DNA-binding beta-propeller fold protein YncE
LLIVVLFGIFYQTPFYCHEAFSQESILKYVKQIGTKGVEKGQFTNPHSLAVDKVGNIFVGDTGNKRVQKFSPNGTFMLSWGSEGNKSGQFMGLHDVAVDPEGKFVSQLNSRIIECKSFILMEALSQNGSIMGREVVTLTELRIKLQ